MITNTNPRVTGPIFGSVTARNAREYSTFVDEKVDDTRMTLPVIRKDPYAGRN